MDIEEQWLAEIAGRFVYHATPLQFLPRILTEGLIAKARLGAAAGRKTARRRDRMLGLADYVHCSFRLQTPLLGQKHAREWPHAIIALDLSRLARREHALLPYNTKSWYSRSSYSPVTDPYMKHRMLRLHDEGVRYPSLEFLAKGVVPIDTFMGVVFTNSIDLCVLRDTARELGMRLPPCSLTPFPWPPQSCPGTRDTVLHYLRECKAARQLLSPPDLPFD